MGEEVGCLRVLAFCFCFFKAGLGDHNRFRFLGSVWRWEQAIATICV